MAVELTISLQGERVAAGVEGERREGGREGGGCIDVERERERRVELAVHFAIE